RARLDLRTAALATSPEARAKQLLTILLDTDRERLERIDDYIQGNHPTPYVPVGADRELQLLARKSITNLMPLLISTPAQACYVDNFRPGRKVDAAGIEQTPEWEHWQASRLDARQAAIYRSAIGFGHAFAVTERRRGVVQTRGLSPLKTAALFADPANDETPEWALTITREAGETPVSDPDRPSLQADNQDMDRMVPGRALMWSERDAFEVTFRGVTDVSVRRLGPHGATSCPVTRFTAEVDLEGRSRGVVEPVMILQDRINQTVFDLLSAQTYNSIKVRTVTGMAPPVKMKNIAPDGEEPEWVAELDENGQPIPIALQSPNRRFMFAENPESRFGTLDETPLDGFIGAIELALRQISATSQAPPHYLVGQIANLSAEALQAAEIALARKIEEYKSSFGESWERVFRLSAELNEVDGFDDYSGEVIWRDMESKSLAQAADALGKMAEQLGIPRRGLWSRVPGVTQNELSRWE